MKVMKIGIGLVLAAMSATAMAGSCPMDMKAIDAALQNNTQLSADKVAQVKKLRAEGETAHKSGNHGESMKKLGEAKQILGI